MKPRLNLDETTLARFCERHHIRHLSLFGSQLKGTARPDSDIDLLVELSRPLGLDHFRIEEELSAKLGAKVQMVTDAALTNHIVRRHALADAIDA